MTLDEMIEVLTAAKNGEAIEYEPKSGIWMTTNPPEWDFSSFNYRIAPKKEVTLVEELREGHDVSGTRLHKRAADRIEELENIDPMMGVATDELLAEIKRRVEF